MLRESTVRAIHLVVMATASTLLACSFPARERRSAGPADAFLVVDLPRREVAGVMERWVVVATKKGAFLLHAVDVERRRARQACGRVPTTAFLAGWEELRTAGLLTPGEDLRLFPHAGGGFPGRLALDVFDHGRQTHARRPLGPDEVGSLLGVLRRWQALLEPEDLLELPARLRIEMTLAGCDQTRQGADRPPGSQPRE